MKDTTTSKAESITRIMHRHVITADAATSARNCAELIGRNRIGCLIVMSDGKPAGIITERSFVNLVKGGRLNPNKVKAGDFMSSPLITLAPRASFAEAMHLFNAKNIKRLPVLDRGKVVGLVSLKDMIEFSNLELARLHEKHRKLKKQSTIDPLTGVLNKAAITRAIENEYQRISRYGGRSSLLFIDIDLFKLVNDTYSHLVGDQVLTQLGKLLRTTCREIDTIGRFGGEEFVVLAPNRKKHHAVAFGQRLRSAVESHAFHCGRRSLKITISIGVSSLFTGRDYHVALERADKALYHAKSSGRNKVGLWRDGKLAVAADS